jgi:thiaminase
MTKHTLNRKDIIQSSSKKFLSDVDYREWVQNFDRPEFSQVVQVLFDIIDTVHQQTINAVQKGEEITLK